MDMLKIRPWNIVDELVVAAGCRDDQISEVITKAEPHQVADLLVSEIKVRCDPPARTSELLPINLKLEFKDELYSYVLTFRDQELCAEAGSAAEVLAEVRYSLIDLTRLLYASDPAYTSTTRDVRIEAWPLQRGDNIDPKQVVEMIRRKEIDREQLAGTAFKESSALFQAVHSVVAACSGNQVGLNYLSAFYGSDKMGAMFSYAEHYEEHLGRIRYNPVRVLEIGIGGYDFKSLGGQSLYMWQRFFPRGLIYGLDIHDKPGVTGPRIRTIQGDQGDPDFLAEMGTAIGPFDVIIDDGSHLNDHVRTSFEVLFPYVRPGGYYIIEDTQTSYWPEFGGALPPGSSLTTIGLIKDLIDKIHFREYADVSDDEARYVRHPSDVSVYHNLAVFRKGINFERGSPAWIRKAAAMRRELGEL